MDVGITGVGLRRVGLRGICRTALGAIAHGTIARHGSGGGRHLGTRLLRHRFTNGRGLGLLSFRGRHPPSVGHGPTGDGASAVRGLVDDG